MTLHARKIPPPGQPMQEDFGVDLGGFDGRACGQSGRAGLRTGGLMAPPGWHLGLVRCRLPRRLTRPLRGRAGAILQRVSPQGDTPKFFVSEAHLRPLAKLSPSDQDKVIKLVNSWAGMAGQDAVSPKMVEAAVASKSCSSKWNGRAQPLPLTSRPGPPSILARPPIPSKQADPCSVLQPSPPWPAT